MKRQLLSGQQIFFLRGRQVKGLKNPYRQDGVAKLFGGKIQYRLFNLNGRLIAKSFLSAGDRKNACREGGIGFDHFNQFGRLGR